MNHGASVSNEAEFEQWLVLALEHERLRLREELRPGNLSRITGHLHVVRNVEPETSHEC